MRDDFNWNKDPDVIIRQQLAVAAWLNDRGDLIIRQEMDWNEESDHVIVVSPANIPALIDKLLLLTDQFSEVSTLNGEAPGKRDATAAERQRRYREKRRLAHGNVPRAAE
jgi:hypothetical protein